MPFDVLTMPFDVIKVRRNHGYQAIRDVRRAEVSKQFRGLPVLPSTCPDDCAHCVSICPTQAIARTPELQIDLGRCIFCGDCIRACPSHNLSFTNFHKIATTSRSHLCVKSGMTPEIYQQQAMTVNAEIQQLLGRSLKLRSVSAAGCNGCEMELNACTNVNFDMGRFGIDLVASPRHADGIVITGPISVNMADALLDTWLCTPSPKIIVVAGACAISGGVLTGSLALDRTFLDMYPPDLFIPGCPFHPLTLVNGILDFLKYSDAR